MVGYKVFPSDEVNNVAVPAVIVGVSPATVGIITLLFIPPIADPLIVID
jgi:hypothetical protein